MIAFERLQVVYIRIPKTANRSITAALRNLDESDGVAIHPEKGQPYWKRIVVPKKFQSFLTIMCVRNPYSRIASHYRHRHLKKTSGAVYTKAKDWSFEKYLSWLEGKIDVFANSRDILQVDYLYANKSMNITILKQERLQQDFQNLPFVPDGFILPRKNVAAPYNWREYYNQTTADRVYRWAEADFEMFDYDRNSWK